MSKKKRNSRKKSPKKTAQNPLNSQKTRNTYEALLGELSTIDQMMTDFLAAETEGLIVCENCYDTAFDDDENLASFTDDEGMTHIFCCRKCMEEWKESRS